MPVGYVSGKPGIVTVLQAVPNDIFISGRETARWIAVPVTVDGTLTACPSNAPYTFQILAGTLMGRVSATKKYTNSILGLSSAAVTATATQVNTDVNTAAEIVRRIGATGTFNLTGPQVASGVVSSQLVTYTGVNQTSGVITCTAIPNPCVTSALIQPTDGSQNILTILGDTYGSKVTDITNVNRIDIFDPRLLAGGPAVIRDPMSPLWPTDPSLQAYVKSAIKGACPAVMFLTDQTG